MERERRVLAFDFGASSGRAILGRFDGSVIRLQEIHRFANEPVQAGGTLYWDVLRLLHEMKTGLLKACQQGPVDSIGIDTWGVDFGLLDSQGVLLENPVHYRDRRTVGILDEAWKLIDRKKLYEITGTQVMEINTAFQLLAVARQRPALLQQAETLLLMPDLLGYFLTGERQTEYSIASTTQLLDAVNRQWSEGIMEGLGLPRRLFTAIKPCPSRLGRLSEEVAAELGVERIPVISVAGHDTQSAMAAVPAQESSFIFLSCGTWSLLGTELPAPLIDAASKRCNMTNEGGAEQRISFLKNISGLWLVQESRRQWRREGQDFSFRQLEELAQEAPQGQCFIDPDNPQFSTAGNIPDRIRCFCQQTGQRVPLTEGEVVRCIDESLALKYRHVLAEVEECLGQKDLGRIHMVGGGIQSRLLCQLTANACQRQVQAGPVEATVLGNIMLQLIAGGDIKNLQEGRSIIARSELLSMFQPQQEEEWQRAYARWKELMKC